MNKKTQATIGDQLADVTILKERRFFFMNQVLVTYKVMIRGNGGELLYKRDEVKWINKSNIID